MLILLGYGRANFLLCVNLGISRLRILVWVLVFGVLNI